MVSADAIPALSADLTALKDEGNDFFRAGDFLKAAGAYTKAIKVSEQQHEKILYSLRRHRRVFFIFIFIFFWGK